MSVRAYKIITKEYEDQPSFNLWHNQTLLDFFQDVGGDDAAYTNNMGDNGCGEIEMTAGLIRKAIFDKEIWNAEDMKADAEWIIERLTKDVSGLTDDDWVTYYCY